MSKTGNTLLTFMAGIGVGVLAGILYAPDKGVNTRDRLSYQLDRYADHLQELIEDLMKGQAEPVSAAKTESQKVIDDAIRHAQQLMDEVDALRQQIARK